MLSEQERADLLAALKEAEEQVKAGKAIDYDSDTFKQRFLDIYRKAER